ncbi:MAG: hypothetical protein AAF447_15000 [Myxococcota bacterium]
MRFPVQRPRKRTAGPFNPASFHLLSFMMPLPFVAPLRVAFLTIALCAWSASARAQSPGWDPDALTPAMASQRAVDTSAELAALRADAESAHLGSDGAVLGLVPRLTLSAGYRRLSPITNPPFGGPPLDASDPPVAGELGALSDPAAAALFDRLTRGNADQAAFPVFLNNYELRARLDYSITAAVLRELPRRSATS